jgi:transposase
MFLKCSEVNKKGKKYKYYNIVESVRAEGKVAHRILVPLGAISDEKAGQIRAILKANGKSIENTEVKTYALSDIIVKKNTDFLNIYVLHKLWNDWRLDELFANFRHAEKLVINRCVDPMSKYRVTQWEGGHLVDKLTGLEMGGDPYSIYVELERIADFGQEIHSHICSLLQAKGLLKDPAVIYDITSTYFERTRCTLAFKGYSRDHRPDKLQIVIAMAVTAEGYPFYWKVYKGNTQDVSTTRDFVDSITMLFGIKNFVLVFDRGMVSDDNIKYIEENKYRFISAIDKNEINTSTPVETEQFQGIEKPEELNGFEKYDDDLWYRVYKQNEHRYVISFSPKKQREERGARKRKLNKFGQEIKKLNDDLKKAKRNRKQNATTVALSALVRRFRLSKLANTQIEPLQIPKNKGNIESFQIQYAINEPAVESAALLDGLTCFHTNTAEGDYAASDVIRQYRQKNTVEEGFHEIKGLIELRPIYLSQDKRVNAHVTICTLAYLLWNDFEKTASKITGLSVADMLSELAKCKSNTITAKDEKQSIQILTEFTQTQFDILKCLGIKAASVENIFKKLVAGG